MGPLDPCLVEQGLDVVGQSGVGRFLERRPPGVAGQRGSEDVVATLERGADEVPRSPRVREAVQAEERRQSTASRSTTKTRGSCGWITPPAPRAP